MDTIGKILFVLFCMFSFPASAHPLVLNEGETFNYQFSNLPSIGSGTFYSGAITIGSVFFSGDALRPGTQLQLTLFENSLADTPLHQAVWTSDDLLGGGLELRAPVFENVWQDLQGAFSMTVLSGAAAINSIDVRSYVPYQQPTLYARIFGERITFVPESSSIFLIVVALSGLLLHRIRRA